MPKCPKIPAAQIKADILRAVSGGDRSIFHGLVADTVHYAPRPKDLRKLREDPERHARTLTSYAKLAGYVEKQITETRHYDVAKLAETLLARHGPEKLAQIWENMGLPVAQLPEAARVQIAAEPNDSPPIEHNAKPLADTSESTDSDREESACNDTI